MDLFGATLVLACQRSDCGAVETIDLDIELDGAPERLSTGGIATAIHDDWPEGWGWDSSGVNRVLHCAEHRGTQSAHESEDSTA